MADTKIRTEKIRETKFDIYVNSAGKFFAQFEGDKVVNSTLEGLRSRLMELTKQKAKNLAIEFWLWVKPYDWGSKPGKPGTLVHGTVTGIHATNSNLMVKLDGQKEVLQARSWDRQNYLRLTVAEQDECVRLHRNLEKAEGEVAKFVAAHTFDAHEETQQALAGEGNE